MPEPITPEQLRAAAKNKGVIPAGGANTLLLRAADRIEQLEADLRMARQGHTETYAKWNAGRLRIEQLEAERDRLAGELERVRARLEAETLRRIECENPGIDIAQVKADRRARTVAIDDPTFAASPDENAAPE